MPRAASSRPLPRLTALGSGAGRSLTLLATLVTAAVVLWLQPVSGQEGAPPREGLVYYVATNEKGASNTACDGLAPTDEGHGHCPFKNFLSAHTFRLLWDQAGVTVKVRQGVYDMTPAGRVGLSLRGRGRNVQELTVLSAYNGESVVFDGGRTMRAVIEMTGSYNLIEGITIQNAGAHNLMITGGHHHAVQDSVIGPNLSSDALKGRAGATRVVIRRNTFYGWNSQAIDLTEVSDWLIEDNEFRDPSIMSAFAVGAKLGSHDVRVERNRILRAGGVALGGTSVPHTYPHAAARIAVRNNDFRDITSRWAFKFYSCVDCVVSSNVVTGVLAGYLLGGASYEGKGGCPGGCPPTRNASVIGNTFLVTAAFAGAWRSETQGLTSESNVYCGASQFWLEGDHLSLASWAATLGTETSSRLC